MKKDKKLDSIAAFVDSEDMDNATAAMFEFIEEHPTDWLQKIMRSDLMSDPIQMEFDIKRNLGVVRTIMKLSATGKLDPDKAFLPMQILACGQAFFETRAMLSKKLETISAFSRNPSQQLYRIAALIESQHAYAERECFSAAVWSPSDALLDNIETKYGLTKSSRVGGLESMADFLDVIIKYIYYKFDPKMLQTSILNNKDSPYADLDFEMLMVTAAHWKQLADLWDHVRFDYCHPLYDKDGVELVPTDCELMTNKEIGIHREFQQALEWNSLPARKFTETSLEYDDLIEKLARQVILPTAISSAWDLSSLDKKKLTTLFKHPISLFMAAFDNERSFIDSKVLQRTYIKIGKSVSINLDNFLKIWRAVRILALIARKYVLASVSNSAEPFDFIPILKYVQLVDMLSSMTSLPKITIQNGLERMIFIEKRSQLDLYDRPFLPIDAETLLFLPSIAVSSNTCRVMQNHLTSNGQQGDFFQHRGKHFEKKIVSDLRKHHDILVKHGLKFEEQEYPEFDIIFHWGQRVFLVEAKCVNHVATIRELFNAKKHIDYSVEQLLRRRKFLLSHWSSVRQQTPELKLPSTAYTEDKIVCVSVNNSMCFTGLHRKDVLIVDDMCFLRYFGGDRTGKKTVMHQGKIVTEDAAWPIRLSDRLDPEEFYRYLRTPPQRERYLNKIQIQRDILRPLEKDMPMFVFPVAKTVIQVDEMTNIA